MLVESYPRYFGIKYMSLAILFKDHLIESLLCIIINLSIPALSWPFKTIWTKEATADKSIHFFSSLSHLRILKMCLQKKKWKPYPKCNSLNIEYIYICGPGTIHSLKGLTSDMTTVNVNNILCFRYTDQ